MTRKRTPFRAPSTKRSPRPGPDARPTRAPRAGPDAGDARPGIAAYVAHGSADTGALATPDGDVGGAAGADSGERIQKFLAEQGVGSRRDLDARIAAGQVSVNGDTAALGQRVRPGDVVRVDGRTYRVSAVTRLPRVLLYHKPEGEISTRDDAKGRPTVFERLPRIRGGKWVAIGRLDINSCGLMILTSSGDLANRLMHPRFEVEREYAVRTLGQLDSLQAGRLLQGIELDDGLARFASLLDAGGEGSNHWYRVIIREGRKREVRRMFEAIGLMVSRLMRVRFGPVELPPHLKRGGLHELTGEDVARLLHWAGLPAEMPVPVAKRPGASRQPRAVLQHLPGAPEPARKGISSARPAAAARAGARAAPPRGRRKAPPR